MKKMNYLMGSAVLLASVFGFAQNNVTVNNGDMYILPNTLISTHSNFENSTSGIVFNDGEFQFYKNYKNDGMFTHTTNSTTGYTVFQGNNPQIISGSLPSRHFDILFNNNSTAYAFQLNNDFMIDGTANFANGIVKINRNQEGAMLFTENSKHINTSDKSYAEGMVEKVGNKPFGFPVGKSELYRPASISAPKEILTLIKTEYFLENSNRVHPHTNKSQEVVGINDKEYWFITRDESNSSVILTLSWNENTTPQEFTDDAQNLVIVRWDDEQNSWMNEGGIVDFANKTVTSPVEISKYGVFTFGKLKGAVAPEFEVIVYNYMTTNDNGKNDYLIIENIERFPENNLEIYNRYGVRVYKTDGYGINGNVFTGYSQAKVTVDKNEKLPTGTYYYILNYTKHDKSGQTQVIKKVGYIHLENH
mgnify:CR=1 FL=1